jgi:tryptophanyl-tRNA synthetase
LAKGCRTAGIGCLECKAVVIDRLLGLLGPYWERRAEFEKNPSLVREILDEGNRRAREVARATMDEVRAALGF